MVMKTLSWVNDKGSRKGPAAFITSVFAKKKKKSNFIRNPCKVPRSAMLWHSFSMLCCSELFYKMWSERGWQTTHVSWERGPPNPRASPPNLEDDILEHSLNKFIFNSRLSSWVGNSYHRPPREGAPKPPVNVAHTPAGRRPRFQDISHRKANTHQDTSTTCHLNLFVNILKASKCAVSFSCCTRPSRERIGKLIEKQLLITNN